MTAFAHKDHLPAFQIRVRGAACERDLAAYYLSLRPTGDGWSLMAPDGRVVFRALGLAGRRRCLEYARELGVLAVIG
jgi:hypothetical protein